MTKTIRKFIGLLTLIPLSTFADYSNHPQAVLFIEKMTSEHNFSEEQLTGWLSVAERQESIIKAMSRPAEKAKPWHEYRRIFVTDKRIERGREFWLENQDTLIKASSEFGVDPAIIVSIIGVETNYGRNVGSYKVIDALTTLAFDYYTNICKLVIVIVHGIIPVTVRHKLAPTHSACIRPFQCNRIFVLLSC